MMTRLMLAIAFLVLTALPAFAQSAKTHTFQNAAAATGDGTPMGIKGWGTIGVQVIITDTATVTFEATTDDSNWVSIGCTLTTTSARSTTATASGLYQCTVAGFSQVRMRVSSLGAGTVTVTGLLTLAGRGGGSDLPAVGSEGDCLLTSSGTWSSGACPGAGTGAPTSAEYWTGADDATLSAEHNLGALGTGMVINTAGTPSIYAGASCTNQVIRVLNASGGATCNTITSAFVDTTVWTGTASSGILKASSQGVLTSATAGTDYASPSVSNSWGDGVRQTFNPNATNAGLNIGSLAGDPVTPSNGDMWYDTGTAKFRCQEGGSTVDCIGAASSAAFSAITNGTNTTAAMVVGTGASLTTSGSGTITATAAAALSANGANCSAGQFPLGVDTAGAVESCTALPTDINSTANEVTASATTGSITLSLPATINLGGKTSLEIPNSATLPATCATGEVYIDSDATSGVRFYYCEATDTWVAPLSAEADTLNTVFGRGDTISGAVSAGTAFQFGGTNSVDRLCAYDDATSGPVIEPCVAGNTATRVLTNQTHSIYDVEGDANMLTIDPDAASVNAMYQFGSGYRPLKSIYWSAGAMSSDGTNCADPAEVTINSGPKQYTIICTENDSSRMHGMAVMPDSWDGGTVTFEVSYVQTAADNGSVALEIAAACRGTGETVNGTYGTEVDVDDAAVTGNSAVDTTTSSAVTPNGTCAAGDLLYWYLDIDATDNPTTAAATLHFLGVKMEYSTSSLSD